jgi:hypothetical protein
MRIAKPQFRQGLRDWYAGFGKISGETKGIERYTDYLLYGLTLFLVSNWMQIGWGSKDKPASRLIEAWVSFGVIITLAAYCTKYRWLAVLSSYCAVSTMTVLLGVVFLRRVFGDPESFERSLVLFMLNVLQIVLMYGTWYGLGEYKDEGGLLQSVLTFATISYADRMPNLAMLQIATNFMLLAIFLAYLVGKLGSDQHSDKY